MNPREINVHIEELVLDGIARGSRWKVAEALQSRLHLLLAEQGIPAAWQASPEMIDAGPIPAVAPTKPATTGEQIARAIYGGGSQ